MPRILALLLLPVLAGALLLPASPSTPPPKTAPVVNRAAVPSVNDAQLDATIALLEPYRALARQHMASVENARKALVAGKPAVCPR